LSYSKESRIENISLFLFKSVDAGKSGEDKSDVLITDGIIFWALDQIYDCDETRVNGSFWTLCI